MSVMRTSEVTTQPPEEAVEQEPVERARLEPVPRPPDDIVEDALDHRRRTARQVRHTARTRLHQLAGDEDALEDADLFCPKGSHDLGRKTSPRPQAQKPGRRSGFKVWKTPFWKRRRSLWHEQNAAMRRLAEAD